MKYKVSSYEWVIGYEWAVFQRTSECNNVSKGNIDRKIKYKITEPLDSSLVLQKADFDNYLLHYMDFVHN